MTEDFQLALVLMGVGMITVFVVLILVTIFGDVIIKVVNRFIPEAPKMAARDAAPPPSSSNNIEPNKLAAIVAAVDIVTKGKGKVTNVKRL